MEEIKKEYQKMISAFPNAMNVDGDFNHLIIPLENDVIIDINYNKYPKEPIIQLIRKDGKKFKNMNKIITCLKTWSNKEPVPLVDIIRVVSVYLDSVSSNTIFIKKELFSALIEICKNLHPKRLIGLLGVHNGIASEYVLPPKGCAPTNHTIYRSCHLPLDQSQEGTILSYANKEDKPSLNDLKKTFRKRRFTIIITYPYDTQDCIICFDVSGNPLEFQVVN